MLAFFLCLGSGTVCAAENKEDTWQDATFVNSRTMDDSVFLYIKGVSDITDDSTVQVGNTLCGDIQATRVASMDMHIRTMILLDNSLSLSKRWGNQAKEFVEALIDNHVDGEEFKIATFADGLNVVSDFSVDYESLKAAVGEIEFLDQDTYLTDMLYDLLKQDSAKREGNYTRYILITDGADDNDIKYTQAELSDLMKCSGVVIHTVGVKASDNAALLELLFSYARMTGGTYQIAEDNTEIEVLREKINEDYSLLCLRLVLPADILDGSRKEAKLNLHTASGPVELTATLQMPFADVGSLPSDEEEPLASPVTETPELPSITVDSQAVEEAPKSNRSSILPVIVIVAIVLTVGIMTVLVALFVWKRNKKQQVHVVISNKEPSENGAGKAGIQEPSVEVDVSTHTGTNTVKLCDHANMDKAGRTQRLQSGSSQGAPRHFYIILTDIHNPQRSIRVPIDTRVVIGRESGDIKLPHDDTVSHTHCEIIRKGNLFYVNDLKSSNGTFYGSMRVYHEIPVMNGGILEIGTGKYKLTIEFGV